MSLSPKPNAALKSWAIGPRCSISRVGPSFGCQCKLRARVVGFPSPDGRRHTGSVIAKPSSHRRFFLTRAVLTAAPYRCVSIERSIGDAPAYRRVIAIGAVLATSADRCIGARCELRVASANRCERAFGRIRPTARHRRRSRSDVRLAARNRGKRTRRLIRAGPDVGMNHAARGAATGDGLTRERADGIRRTAADHIGRRRVRRIAHHALAVRIERQRLVVEILHAHVTVECVRRRDALVSDDHEAEVPSAHSERTLRRQRYLHAGSGRHADVVASLRTGRDGVVRLVEVHGRRQQCRPRVEQRHFAREADRLRRHGKHDADAERRGRLRRCNVRQQQTECKPNDRGTHADAFRSGSGHSRAQASANP